MKIYGGVCSKEGAPSDISGFNYENCETLNALDNFDNIGSAMVLLFQICTGQDTAGIMQDLSNNAGSTLIFPFFLMFYVLANLVMINLFVAVLLENFEYNIADESFSITEEDVELFKDQWDENDHEGCEKLEIPMREIAPFVSSLEGCFSLIRDFDQYWQQQLTMELKNESQDEIEPTDMVSFHLLLLCLCSLRFGSNCQSYSEQLAKAAIHRARRVEFANRVLVCCLRAKMQARWPPEDYTTEIQKRRWRAAVNVCRLLTIDMIVRHYKVTGAEDLQNKRISVLGAAAALEEDEETKARRIAELNRSVKAYQTPPRKKKSRDLEQGYEARLASSNAALFETELGFTGNPLKAPSFMFSSIDSANAIEARHQPPPWILDLVEKA